MATTITFEHYSHGPDGRGGKVSGTADVDDVVVKTTPNQTGGWNTATVTADKQRGIRLDAGNAAGVPAGWYENAGGAIFARIDRL